MKSGDDVRAALAEVRRLTADRQFADAERLLDQICADPAQSGLGQRTVLGPSRQVVAAQLRLAKAMGDDLGRIGLQYHLVPPPEVLLRHAAFSTAERRAIAAANRVPVPHVLHQIWIGPKPPPVTAAAWHKHSRATGFDYRLWREADLQALGVADNPAFADMLARGDYPGAVDVARYLVLLHHGGLYLDCDWYPARSDVGFADRLPLIGLTALAEDTPRKTGQGSLLLSNAFIATPPAHPVLRRLVDVLPQAMADLPGAPAWWATGPLLFTVIARATSVSVTEAGLVAGHAQPGAGPEAIAALCAAAERLDQGLLLAWKPW